VHVRVLALVVLLASACSADPEPQPPSAPGTDTEAPLATPEEIAAAPTVTLVVANHSAYPLRLPGTWDSAGWFRVNGHAGWFVWDVPDEFSESSICEDVTAAQLGEQPMDEVMLGVGGEYRLAWKTNVFGAGEVDEGLFGPTHCVHVHPVAPGTYQAEVCATLASVHCSVQPTIGDFTQRCVPATLTIPDQDGELAAAFEVADFPDNTCAADR